MATLISRTTLAVSALGLAFAVSLPAQEAQAGAKAVSILEILDLKAINADTGAALSAEFDASGNFAGGDFTSLVIEQNEGTSNVSFNGADTTGSNSNDTDLSDGVILDSYGCQGTGCGAGDQVDNFFAETANTNAFALSDTLLNGAIIDVVTPIGTIAAGASSQQKTELQAFGDALATGSSTQTTVSTFTFGLAEDTDVAFEFSPSVILKAFLDDFGSGANANASFNITLEEFGVGTIFSFSLGTAGGGLDDEFAVTRTISFAGAGTTEELFNNGGSLFTTDSVTLSSGSLFQLTIDGRTSADITSVPVPASLAFLGGGLIGLGVIGRRRRKTA